MSLSGHGEVSGWIFEKNLDGLISHVGAYVGYRWDHLDDDALIGALDSTDAEKSETWFEYPVVGTPPVMLTLARDVGTDVLSVRITGLFDAVLAARFETLLDVC